MNYGILIVTNKHFDEICDRLQKTFGRWMFKYDKNSGELWLAGIRVTIKRNALNARGSRAHVIYADEEFIEDEEILNNILIPCVNIWGSAGVLPLDKKNLRFIFGIEEEKQ